MDLERCKAAGFDVVAFMQTPPSSSHDHKAETSLYVIQNVHFVKVGIARDIPYRISQFQAGNPYPIDLIFEATFDSRLMALLVERTIHGVLEDARHFSEWFRCEPDRAVEVARLVSEAGLALSGRHDEQREISALEWQHRYETDPRYAAERADNERKRDLLRDREAAIDAVARAFDEEHPETEEIFNPAVAHLKKMLAKKPAPKKRPVGKVRKLRPGYV